MSEGKLYDAALNEAEEIWEEEKETNEALAKTEPPCFLKAGKLGAHPLQCRLAATGGIGTALGVVGSL